MSRRNVGTVIQGAVSKVGGDLTSTGPSAQYVTLISGANGAGGTVALNGVTLQWTSASTTSGLSQAALSALGTPANMTFVTQAPNGASGTAAQNTPGNFIFNVGTPGAVGTPGTHGYLIVQDSGATIVSVGSVPFGGYGVFFGSAAQSGTNFSVLGDGSNTYINTPSSTIYFTKAAATLATMTNSLFAIAPQVGGSGTTPFSWSGQTTPNTVAGTTGGTQTISAAQAIIPFFLLTCGILTSSLIVDFGTNAVTGYYCIDISGLGTLGGFTVGFKNGTTTKTITATQLANLIATGATAVQVWTYGTNNITLVS